ncbi:facilitated trehalose transporter Tret1-like [Chrysoperla carnea]|uniref:facilitated trehalose transporter Tret1-like n=1 Tax=Chrysoperla carnea TaxID=189513 RepID=UPI001D05D68B|nr:facilitated trehalose transporter Tret1-like [Chrysoperla carnea]
MRLVEKKQMEQNKTSMNLICSYSKLPDTLPASNPKNFEQFETKIEHNKKESFLSTKNLMPIEIDTSFEDGQNHMDSNIWSEKSWFSRQFLIQFGIIYVASLLMFITGMHTGWVGPTILKLSSNDSDIPLTSTEISWLASMVPFGGGIGPIFGAILANKIGRKKTILLIAIPEIFTWIAVILAKDIYCLCAAQFVRGITGGAAFAVIPMYVGEISSPKFRGVLGIVFILQYHAGFVLEIALVPFVSVSANAWIALSILTFLVLVFIWMPESPYYFILKNQASNAGKSLRILNQNDEIDKHLEKLKRIVQAEQNEVHSFTEIFRTRNNRVSFILCLGVMSIQPLTGFVPVLAYTQLTLEKSNSFIDPNISGIIIGSFGLIFLFLGCFFVDSYGRRPILLCSTFGTTIPFLLIAVYFHLDYLNYEYIRSFTLLPLIGLILHQVTSLFGICPIPYVYISESFSTNIKSFASLFIICYGSIMSSVCSKIYPDLCALMGIHNVYYLLVCGCILSGIGTYFFVPETKGKTLHEIQKFLREY